MKYFAYGSNMCQSRLSARIISAEFVDVAKVAGFELKFHTKSAKDPSGKADLVRSNNNTDAVYGVLYEISNRDKHQLDYEEGLGYGCSEVIVKVQTKKLSCYAFTYIARKAAIDEELLPFSWYRDLCLQGAKEHGLPKDYVSQLAQAKAITDNDLSRESIHRRFIS